MSKLFDKVHGGGVQRIKADDINELQDEITACRIKGASPNVAVVRNSGGTYIGIKSQKAAAAQEEKETLDYIEFGTGLASTTWNLATDGQEDQKGYTKKSLINMRYNTTTHTLQGLYMVTTVNCNGRTVSEDIESDWVNLATAVACATP